MKISVEAKSERLGEFIVFNSVGQPAEVPNSIAIIGGGPDGTSRRTAASTQTPFSICPRRHFH